MSLRLGLTSPVVVQLPGGHSAWEASASPEDLARVATTADRLGYDHLTCSEHVAVPADIAAERGGVYYDPLATLSWIAASTHQIRLATSVLVLGYHHPLAIAKRYGTLDLLSGGRVVLGVGVGSLPGEFEMLGAQFEKRGAIADDRLAALRSAWGKARPSHHGPHVEYDDVVVEPHAIREQAPIWVGGRTARSLRRAVELGTGWVPFGLPPQALRDMLAEHDLPAGFEVVLGPHRALDPMAAPEAAIRSLESMRDVGATVVQIRLVADSAAHYLEQLEAATAIAENLG